MTLQLVLRHCQLIKVTIHIIITTTTTTTTTTRALGERRPPPFEPSPDAESGSGWIPKCIGTFLSTKDTSTMKFSWRSDKFFFAEIWAKLWQMLYLAMLKTTLKSLLWKLNQTQPTTIYLDVSWRYLDVTLKSSYIYRKTDAHKKTWFN